MNPKLFIKMAEIFSEIKNKEDQAKSISSFLNFAAKEYGCFNKVLFCKSCGIEVINEGDSTTIKK